MFHLSNLKKTIGLLILCLIICSCFTLFFTKVFGLDEWIDNYENENYVQWKENIIRNDTLDCMELNYSVGSLFQDFTTWIESDALNRLSQTVPRSTWTDMETDDPDIYLYKDFGVDNIYDFSHIFQCNITELEKSASQPNRGAIWVVSTVLGDLVDIYSSGNSFMYITTKSNNVQDEFQWGLSYKNGANTATDWSVILDVATEYYLYIYKRAKVITAKIYDDIAMSSLVDTITVTMVADDSYRYMMIPCSQHAPSDTWKWSGYVEYFLINDGKIYENLNDDYTEVDNANNRITFPYGDYYVQYASHRAEWVYLYYDYGVNYFDDFVHELDCYMVSSPLYGIGFFYVLSNVIKAQRQMQLDNDNFFAIVFYYGGGGDEIQFRYCDGITTHQLGYSCNKMVWYYLRVIKNDTDIDLEIFSDSERTTLLDTLHFDLTSDEKFRYIYACNGYQQAGYTQILTLYAKDYWIGKYSSVFGYLDNGIFYTKDILDYVNGSSIVLLTESTIPVSDGIKVQFSPNNSSWYSHNAVLTGYDDLVAGLESIDLRDLNYSSNIYMRFNFSDGGSDSTPRLFQLRLITSANVTGGGPGPVTMGGGVGFVVGGWILLPPILLIIGYMLKRGKRK